LALRQANPLSAAGLDGITFEIWKALLQSYKRPEKDVKAKKFDVIKFLTLIYNDIMQHGIEDTSSFTEGWMCPLYKKGDRTKIENYRPITLLNSDYKLMTKVLATRLSHVAPTIIDKSQAGFIRGRQISDHTRLVKMLIHYA